ncbi:MAG: response regulator [Alphaproteobacteria bacterium]|nr:response regulator [Alphaproteobacteria bacterium]
MAFYLVVEDNPANVALISEVLEDEGHRFEVATDGASGLAFAYNLMPDIILMDVSLPLVSGLDAATILKNESRTRDIPILALTAHAMQGDREECLRAGCDDYETKPINTARVLQKADALMRNRDPSFVAQLDRLRGGEVRSFGAQQIARLNEQLGQVREALETAEAALQEEQEAHAAVKAQLESQNNRSVLRRMQALEMQLTVAKEEKDNAEARIEQARAELERDREQLTLLFESRMREVHQAHAEELSEARARLDEAVTAEALDGLREEQERALAALRREHEAALVALQESHAQQLADQSQAHAGELEALCEDHRRKAQRASVSRRSSLQRKLETVQRRVEEMEAKERDYLKRIQGLRDVPVDVQMLQTELQRARTDAATSRRVLTQLQKTVRQAVDTSYTEVLNATTELYAK